MNRNFRLGLIWIYFMLMFGVICFYGQVDQLHGDQDYSTYGVHSGNQIRTSFWNDGQIGYRNPETQEQVRGEWPINSGHFYIAKISSYFGSEVYCEDGIIRPIVSEANGTRAGNPAEHSSGDASEDGEYWSMCPLPGFYNMNPPPEEADQPWVAMFPKRWSWPYTWPDKMGDAADPGWHGFWNGYFGKDESKAADQESYYLMDDYNNREFPFYPDSTNRNRRGLGLRVTVRGMQWNQSLVEDAIFWLFDAENVGTYNHKKMAFGINCGPDIGGDSDDDGGSYDLVNDVAYQYDGDFYGSTGWYPVGLLGLAFLETPGNPYDGIDNDGDGATYAGGQTLTTEMFQSRTVNEGDTIIMIDYNTYERSKMPMPAEGVTITYADKDYSFLPGELEETPQNLIDDDLDGLIDENNGRLVGTGDAAYHVYLYEGLKYVDYYTGDGLDNPMIDERRDDGIDNNNDWDPLIDDVGLDGKAETFDEGESDGVATSGFGTDRPGEPNIDKTDIDESDQIGLTSFILFDCHDPYQLYNDEKLWTAVEPGYLDPTFGIGNTDIMMGSAYFTLAPREIRRVSFALLFGAYSPGNLTADLIRNKQGAQAAYNANYQFAKAPPLPIVTYLAEDGKVTLYWTKDAENFRDPLTGYDFEGYKIYRSTDPAWNDMETITDGYGTPTSFRQPIAQFDKENQITGFSQTSYFGVQFYYGSDTGLAHSWTDTTVMNGQQYYYAVTAYDHGADSLGVFPSECSKYLSINADGTVEKDSNVVIVCPEAPSAGFENASFKVTWKEGSTTNATIAVPIENNSMVNDGTYEITFEDTLIKDRLWMIPYTKNFTLTDVTHGGRDTLILRSTDFETLLDLPDNPGLHFILQNKASIGLNIDSTAWKNPEEDSPNIFDISFQPAYLIAKGQMVAGTYLSHDYRIVFGNAGLATSSEFGDFPAMDVNFKVYNASANEEIAFSFDERDGEGGVFSAFTAGALSDRIYFLEKDEHDSLIITIQFELKRAGSDSLTRNPESGDTLHLVLNKPFLSHDVALFSTRAAHIDEDKAKSELDNIKVVPNPYIVSNSWEPRNLYSSGRGRRSLHFIHLPKECTIRIFTIQGQLVQKLTHNSTIWDGTEDWDMLSKDKLDIAYGIYFYHVEVPGIGNKIGKFAVIK
ncbi:hypothetical protein JW835_16305 [bacterium]|nr:hypothetical protein [bacterium]